ncbi:phosphate transporter, putative [Perkinsus marinus ATCC 50983]|uniref:Phosphate transporter n=1 Tax=Perkinsus marinus (strain ATCC 50983 / TXsc) TaxID=423536 RepID=C5LCP8_PERM5|nr:phosphate transporter, putative [Perkinsus marinus ATCC 50983]EER05731.1 phosphate transporter, putative [Perkinsus marinus ATCC 50983]|eukprot:XP_002773915.1 phosphate transporter, putative [Perkinsus marinus ATCC 50983]
MLRALLPVTTILPLLVHGLADPTTIASNLSAFQSEFLWLVIMGFIVGFIMAYGIGANDVANSFSAAVGAKSVTLKQAVVLAAICEMVGVIGMGASVTDTVRKGILNGDYFLYNPDLLMLAMFSALTGAGAWLVIATVMSFPVSTTHSIIGGLIGVGMSVSYDAVDWLSVLMIIVSWITSPLLAAIVGGSWFLLVRTFILRKGDNAAKYSYRFFPVLLLIVFISVCLFIVFKNSQEQIKAFASNYPAFAALTAVGIGIVLAFVTYIATYRLVKRRIAAAPEVAELPLPATAPVRSVSSAKPSSSDDEEVGSGVTKVEESPVQPKRGKVAFNRDLHSEARDGDVKIAAIQDNAEVFPPKAEETFKILQVVSASFASVSHGANDVANAIGPIASIWGIWQTADVVSSVAVPLWILFFGGAGIVIGLLTYGYNVIRTVGCSLIKISPARGSSIELGSAWVVLVGSNLGIPLSTTHCMVGSTIGVGLCEKNGRKSVNWSLFVKIAAAWVFTLFFAAVTSSAIFGFMSTIYHPRLTDVICSSGQSFVDVYTGIPNVSAAYTSAGLSGVFQSIDVNGDGHLSMDELSSAGMGVTASGDNPIEVYGGDDVDYLTKDDWLSWRCVGKTELTTLSDRFCEPLCASGFSLSGPLQCSLVSGETLTGGYSQSASLSIPSCQSISG